MNLIHRAAILSAVAAALIVTPSWSAPQQPESQQAQAESKEDRDLAAKVRQALTEQQLGAPNQRIEVQARDGVVTLVGEVASQQISTKAEEAAKRIAGDGKVVNQLQVKS